MIKSIILSGSLILLSGCSEYTINGAVSLSEERSAISWYKDNLNKIKALTPQQEGFGWILKCGDKEYYNTSIIVGGLKNSISPPSMYGCTATGLVHTHPREVGTGSVDYFSQGDLNTSKRMSIYLFTVDSCTVRVANNVNLPKGSAMNPYGRVLGKLDCNK